MAHEAGYDSNIRRGIKKKSMSQIKKIKQLEAELEKYKNRAYAGRKKHDSAWMQSYNAFVVQYEKGKTIMEIVEQGDISRRTAYRYKAYYKKLKRERNGG